MFFYGTDVTGNKIKEVQTIVQANLDLRNFIFPFLNRELFDSGKIHVLNLKTGRPKKK